MPGILIIDDEKSIRNTLKEILEYEKFEVYEAADGTEALKLVAETDFEAILCCLSTIYSKACIAFGMFELCWTA